MQVDQSYNSGNSGTAQGQYAHQNNQFAPQNNQYAPNQYQGAPPAQYTPSTGQYAPAMAHPAPQYPQMDKYAQAPQQQQFSQAGAPPQQYSQSQWGDKYAQAPPQQYSQAGAPPQQYSQYSQAGAPPQQYSQAGAPTQQFSQQSYAAHQSKPLPPPPASEYGGQPNQYAPPSAQYGQAPQVGQSGVGGSLSVLTSLPHVTIHQKIERLEIFTGWETANRYAVVGPRNEPLFFCGEKSSTAARMFLGADRPLDFDVVDGNKQKVMHINRPFKLWKKNVMIEDGQGSLIGYIRKKFAITKKQFIMEDNSGRVLFTIEGPPIMPYKFKILDASGVEVGQILKKWTGLAQELFSDADSFTCFFPPNADAYARAMVLAATLFIDLTYFESK